MPHYLYKHFCDGGNLLYVGITNDLRVRHIAHRKNSEWWPLIKRFRSAEYRIRFEAEIAEIDCILDYRPKYNVLHNNDCDLPLELLSTKRRIRIAIGMSGLTVQQIADELGVSKGAVGHWQSERQSFLPTMSKLADFCRICGVEPNDLFDEFAKPTRKRAA